MEKAKEQINALITAEEFLKIEQELNQFNIFKAMELETSETRHSKFLAYLLNPQETHQMGDLFLKEFLKEVFPEEKINLDGRSFSDFQVKTEVWCDDNKENRLDILLLNPKEKIFYAIEHKIKAKAGKGQLDRYKKTLSKKYHNYTQKFLFLTPDGDDPKDNNWTSVPYEKISAVLDRIIKFYDYKISKDFLSILKQYKTTIKRDICMNDEKLNQLCDELYLHHKKALDYMMDFLGRKGFLGAVLKAIKDIFDQDSQKRFSTKLMPARMLVTFNAFKGNPSFAKPKKGFYFEGTDTYIGLIFEEKKEKDGQKGLCWKFLLGPTENLNRKRIVNSFKMNYRISKEKKGIWTTLESTPKFLSSEQIEKFNDGVDIKLKNEVEKIITEEYPKWEKDIKTALRSVNK